jgi:hypothetical protein
VISLCPSLQTWRTRASFFLLAACSKHSQHMWPYEQLRCCWHNFRVHWCTPLQSVKNIPTARWRCQHGGIFVITISLIITTTALCPRQVGSLLCTAPPVWLHLCSRILKRRLQIWEPLGDTETALSYSWSFVANTFLGHTIIQCLQK